MAGMMEGETTGPWELSSEGYGANHMGMGKRPSMSHHWLPGYGWTFVPTYDEGNSLNDQVRRHQEAGLGGEELDVQMDAQATADAKATGVDVTSASQGLIEPGKRTAIQQRQSSQYYYYAGMDHFDDSGLTFTGDDIADYANGSAWDLAAGKYFSSIGSPNGTQPWRLNSFGHARGGDFNAIKEDNYNPFIGQEGAWVDPDGVNGQDWRGSMGGTAEGYFDDSLAGWFKNAFSGEDMVKHRWNAVHDLKNYAANGTVARKGGAEFMNNAKPLNLNKATTRMSQKIFDEMKLAEKYGLTYEDPRPQQYADAYAAVTGGGSTGGYMGGSFMDNYGQSPVGLEAGGAQPAAPAGPQVKPGGFMEAYLQKKAENKPSVMSLMTELKDA